MIKLVSDEIGTNISMLLYSWASLSTSRQTTYKTEYKWRNWDWLHPSPLVGRLPHFQMKSLFPSLVLMLLISLLVEMVFIQPPNSSSTSSRSHIFSVYFFCSIFSFIIANGLHIGHLWTLIPSIFLSSFYVSSWGFYENSRCLYPEKSGSLDFIF